MYYEGVFYGGLPTKITILENSKHRQLIVTTMQKMANAVKRPQYEKVMDAYRDEKVVFIIDECHRSQFGDMHKDIVRHFKKAQFFGFTGTPRFEVNGKTEGKITQTTEMLFGECLHNYLIKDAIFDNNVLGFHIEYIKTMEGDFDWDDPTLADAIDVGELYMSDERMSLIANHIVQNHKAKTRNGQYTAIFAVSSIEALVKYYDIFKKIKHDLNISGIFSYGQNEDAEGKDEHSRDALERIINDYNEMYGTNFSTDTFSAYHKDISDRVKGKKTKSLDILIVVNMFLTGFDSKQLSVLYVDKDLKYHDLLQAYSRTNRVEKETKPFLKDDNISYEDAWNDEEYKAAIVEEALRDLGYIIEPEYLFRKMVKMVENRSFDIEFLQKAINALMESTIGNDSQEDFDGLFSDMQLDSTKLGHTVKDRSAVMAKIIASLDEINFSVDDTKIDVLGNAYEYLIGQFAATAGKKAGEFYTPSGPAELLCRLACLGLTDVKDAADPTCGSGSLLLRLKNYANVRNYYGQELTSTTYNLARMNMILRGIPYRNFNIYNGDTLEHDYFGDMKFRVQVANPPYSANWSADMHFMEDERFNEYGKLAPKSKADFAFVQHMVYHMDEDGRAVVLLPHGVLFRGAAEEVIRKHLIQKLNVLDAVIGLPANLFFGTGIPVCVLVLKRERNGNSDNILFIDASNDFEAGKNQNILRECDIDKIVKTYEHRVDVDKYAHVATMQEIEENGFNLNIPRYVDTFEPEEEIDLNAVAAEIRNIQAEIKGIDAQLKPFFDELGLDFPFDVEGK